VLSGGHLGFSWKFFFYFQPQQPLAIGEGGAVVRNSRALLPGEAVIVDTNARAGLVAGLALLVAALAYIQLRM
jgi:hypothetical protein